MGCTLRNDRKNPHVGEIGEGESDVRLLKRNNTKERTKIVADGRYTAKWHERKNKNCSRWAVHCEMNPLAGEIGEGESDVRL